MTQNDNGSAKGGAKTELQKALASLQDDMAMVDLFARPQSGQRGMELLLKEYRLLRIKMDGNRNHARPHIHIDYHRTHHLASYAIDDSSRIAGSGSYDRVIRPWVKAYRDPLMRAWEELRSKGVVGDEVIAELKGSKIA